MNKYTTIDRLIAFEIINIIRKKYRLDAPDDLYWLANHKWPELMKNLDFRRLDYFLEDEIINNE